MKNPVAKTIALTTLVSGTLDILFAMILTVAFGREIGNMLRYVASGPFPAAVSGNFFSMMTKHANMNVTLILAPPLMESGKPSSRISISTCAQHKRVRP